MRRIFVSRHERYQDARDARDGLLVESPGRLLQIRRRQTFFVVVERVPTKSGG